VLNYRSQTGALQLNLDARDVHLRNLDGTIRANAASTLTGEEDFLGTRFSGQIKDLSTGRDANGNPVLMVLSFVDRRLDIYQVEPTWTAGAGSWETATNWNLSLIADGATQNARFNPQPTPTTITLNTNKTTKLLKLDSAASYTISGTGTLTTDAPSGKGAHIAVLQGSHTIAVPVVAAKGTDLRVPSGSTLTLSQGVSGSGITKRGGGVTEVEHFRMSAVNVAEGTLRVNAGPDSVSRTADLQVQAGATLDLNSALIVDYGATDPEAALIAQIGTGIVSTLAASEPDRRAIGVAQASELGLAGTFGGLPVDATAVILRSTLRGDADLNGTVDFPDLLKLAQNYDTVATGKRWAQGDTNGNTIVDFDDLLKLAQNYGFSALLSGEITLDEALQARFESDLRLAISMVPEPTTLAVLMAAAVLGRRRR
jgi:hypothetical protein